MKIKKQLITRKYSRKENEKFHKKGKHNVSLTVSNETNIKNSRNVWLKTNHNIF